MINQNNVASYLPTFNIYKNLPLKLLILHKIFTIHTNLVYKLTLTRSRDSQVDTTTLEAVFIKQRSVIGCILLASRVSQCN